MKMLKKSLLVFLKSAVLLFGFIVVYFLFAVLLGAIPVNRNFKNENKGVEIFVLSNGVHADFVLPVRTEIIRWDKCFPYSDFEAADESFSHIAFGWGDKGFFIHTPRWADLTLSTAFKACFWLGTSAMHVTYKNHPPQENEKCRRLIISESKYKILVNFILNSFEKNNDGKIMRIDAKGYGMNDCFYEAEGTYSLFTTCNIWTNNGLKLTGVRTALWSPFDKAIFYQLK